MKVGTPSQPTRRWAAAAATYAVGLLAAGALVGARPLAVVAQVVIEATPGPVATLSIELLGKAAQPTLVAGLVVGIVVAGAALGRVRGRLPDPLRRETVGITLLGVVTAGLFVAAGGGAVAVLLGTVIAAAPAVSVRWLAQSVGGDERRTFLRRAGVAGFALSGLGVGAAAVGRVTEETGGVQPGESFDSVDASATTATRAMQEKTEGTTTPTVTPGATESGESMLSDSAQEQSVAVSERETDEPFGFDFEGMPPRLTPVADHYVVDKQLDDPDLSADDWSLTVGVGDATDGRREFSLTDLVGHPDRTTEIVTMACISNPVGGPLISTMRWRGVPVIDLLEEVGVADGATDVITRAADGYEEAIPLEVVRERDDVLIAYGMNGQTLPKAHGFPARLLIPGRYGMKMTKWVTGLGAATDDRIGYWTNRGWTEEAVVQTLSAIRAAQRRGSRIAVGGLAFAGDRGISEVEVSLDGGNTWNTATLDEPLSPQARRRWRYTTEREPGRVQAVVRATDGTGTVQTQERSPPHPNGATGWHQAAFDL